MKTLFIAMFKNCNAVYGASFSSAEEALCQARDWVESESLGSTDGLYCAEIECGDDAALDDFLGCCDEIEYMRVAEKTL